MGCSSTTDPSNNRITRVQEDIVTVRIIGWMISCVVLAVVVQQQKAQMEKDIR
jgi:hypothetical protein